MNFNVFKLKVAFAATAAIVTVMFLIRTVMYM